MSLADKINEELKLAMKNRDQTRLAAIRSVRNEIIKFNKSGGDTAIGDETVIKFIKGQIKQRQDAIVMFQQGNRLDLVMEEENQMAALKNLLPPGLDENEMAALVTQAITITGAASPQDMGMVMKALMPLVKSSGKDGDNRLLSEMVKSKLSAS